MLTDDEKSALRELRAAGGGKRYSHCRCSPVTVSRLIAAGFVALDEGPRETAKVRITVKGRIAIVDETGPIPPRE